jgi:hypothetical protein
VPLPQPARNNARTAASTSDCWRPNLMGKKVGATLCLGISIPRIFSQKGRKSLGVNSEEKNKSNENQKSDDKRLRVYDAIVYIRFRMYVKTR